jgi:RNA polymerase sigma-70 factor (ECF subfamily)
MLSRHEAIGASSDGDRIRLAREGDPAALNELVGALSPMLLRYARAQLRRDLRARMGASDVVQGALLEALRDLPAFSGSTMAELRAWVRGILRRNVLDDVKAQAVAQRRAVSAERPLEGDRASPATSPSQKVARLEQVVEIARFVDDLPEAARRTIHLWLADHSIREIAQELGKTEQAAASLLKRALEHLRARAARAKQ